MGTRLEAGTPVRKWHGGQVRHDSVVGEVSRTGWCPLWGEQRERKSQDNACYPEPLRWGCVSEGERLEEGQCEGGWGEKWEKGSTQQPRGGSVWGAGSKNADPLLRGPGSPRAGVACWVLPPDLLVNQLKTFQMCKTVGTGSPDLCPQPVASSQTPVPGLSYQQRNQGRARGRETERG